MGSIVNGRGESKHADIGISLPGTGETPAAPVFIDGKKSVTLRGPTVAADFKQMVIDYIERRFGHGGAGRTAAEEGRAKDAPHLVESNIPLQASLPHRLVRISR